MRVTAARIGKYDPLVAVEDELRGADYDGVVISTLPPGVSRWLRLDLPARVSDEWLAPTLPRQSTGHRTPDAFPGRGQLSTYPDQPSNS